jgi:phage anti-repressor protein
MEKHNQFIIPESINFTELIKNNESILGLSEEYQCKMINELNTEFTEQEQRWYIANFYIYMNYHSTNDYPINLEDVFKMIGFANKGNAMKTIRNNFTEDEDYKILSHIQENKTNVKTCEKEVIVPMDKNLFTKDLGGRPTDTIMLNVDTFKSLCMLARTEKGTEIRKYYVKLENIYNKIVKEERENMQKLLEEERENAQKLIQEIQEKDLKLEKFTRKNNFKKCESIYVFTCDYLNRRIHKVGKSNNANKRETQLITGNIIGQIDFSIKCINKTLIEQLTHQILDQYRMDVRREWFDCDLETVKNAILYAKLVSEDMLDCNVLFLLENFKNFVSQKNRETVINSIPLTEKYPEEMILNLDDLLLFKPKDPTDFELFLNECCDINSDYTISNLELKQQYHLWSHNSEHAHWTTFIENLNKDPRFSIVKKHLDENKVKSKKQNFKGFKLKSSMYEFDKDEPGIISKFLYEKCNKSPLNKINHKDLYKEYSKYTNTPFSLAEKDRFDNYMDVKFLRTKVGQVVGIKDNRIYGWTGINLKTSTNLKIKTKTEKETKKESKPEKEKSIEKIVVKNSLNANKIKQTDSTGTRILKIFDSQRDVAKYLSISTCAVSTNIKKGILITDPNTKEQTYFKRI